MAGIEDSMLLILPAAKTLDFEMPGTAGISTQPDFLEEAALLAGELRALTPAELAVRMALSEKLAQRVFAYYQAWNRPFTLRNAKPALLAYAGDLYEALEAKSLTEAELDFAQGRVRILSGLYGLLRPLDLMAPYRLAMGGRMSSGSLYAFWGDKLTEALNLALDAEEAQGREPFLLNLASQEYAKAIRPERLRGRMITPVFQEGRAGRFKVVSFFAKRARGLMARFVLQGRLAEPEAIQAFREDGYALEGAASTADLWCFRREVS